jgi:lysophospholipase L1-like esterase
MFTSNRVTGLLIGASATLLGLTACGSDGGNASGAGGSASVVPSSGGAPVSAGGSATGAGGSATSLGGSTTGVGGSTMSLGGSTTSAGGSPTSSGGSTTGTGGSSESSAGGSSTGGGTSAGGSSGTSSGGASGGGGAATKSPCIATPANDGAFIGDSYVTGFGSPALQPALGALDAQALQFQNYAVAGTSLATGGLTGLIPPQLMSVKAGTKLLVMDGGGNDILICDTLTYASCNTVCSTAGSSKQKVCTDIVNKAITTATSLIGQAATKGITDVVYFFYPHIPAPGGGGGGYSEILDYSEPLAKAACDAAEANSSGKLRCYFVSTVEAFKAAGGDKNAANFAADGIHPSDAGQKIVAAQIWSTMKANCVGQPSSSGCCAP